MILERQVPIATKFLKAISRVWFKTTHLQERNKLDMKYSSSESSFLENIGFRYIVDI